MPRHNINLLAMPLHKGLVEEIEHGLAEILVHARDLSVEAETSTLTIKIKVKPTDAERRTFAYSVEPGALTLAPRRGFKSSFFAGTDQDGMISTKEDDPRQAQFDWNELPTPV